MVPRFLSGAFTCGVLLLTSMASASANPTFCRVALADGRTSYAAVEGDQLHLLDRAPWLGGRDTGATVAGSAVKFLPPSEPRNILCLANSYAGKEKQPPATIRWFAKSAGAAATDGDVVDIPPAVDQLKSEVEVVIVVGRHLKNAGEDEARRAIFGYTVGNEIFGFPESYHRVHHEDPRPETMLAAGLKLGDKFAPFGPFVHQGADWPRARRTLVVANPARGKSVEYAGDTSGLLYSPERVLSELSRVLALEPGDLVFTGTTQALVLERGDEVTAEIEGLGRLHNTIQ